MDFHLPSFAEIWEIVQAYPVIIVLLGGLLFGSGVTQLVKHSYRDWFAHTLMRPISDGRFRFSVRILSAASTYAFTLALWHIFLGHAHGDEVIGAGTAIFSPALYDFSRALIRWKWPGLVRSWNEDQGSKGSDK